MQRRTILKLSGAAALSAFAHNRLIASTALKPLDASHPAAKALAYVENAADADPSRYLQGSRCDNCTHYQPQQGASDIGGCALFPGFSVVATGWCAGWVAQNPQSG
ncbi:MAG: high-potential iron-sulfur protein [Pseudomonadales bacterium]